MTTMKSRKLKALGLMLALGCASAMAIPADPSPKQVRQPDGTTLTVIIRGDEWGHIRTTDDGIPLYYNKATRTFEYARLDGNALTGSGVAARNAGKRSEAEKNLIKSIDYKAVTGSVIAKAKAKRAQAKPNRIRINNFPTLGKQKSLVILWEFSDQDFASVDDPKQFFTDMLNKEGFTYSNGADGSARDFYLASSAGMFDPEFVVAGPVKLSHEATYYGSDTGGQDHKIYEAIIESCQALDDEIDFSEYDADGDGYVDNIYFQYAGYGQADTPNGDDFIWPHSWNLESGHNQELILDGKRIDRYTCSNELRYMADGSLIPTGIGTFVHEFGHVLGLADHYDVAYSMFGFDPGPWDTMASGSYNNNMNTPPVFSAFERAELGWLEYTDLDINADTISTLPNLADCNKAYRVKVEGNDNEYFILENRQQRGWDAYLPGHGMLMWHIDMDEEAWMNNMVNTDPGHQRVDIVEADGIGSDASMTGDPFPGTAGVTEWDLTAWNGSVPLALADVTERGDTIRLLPKGTQFKLAAPDKVDIMAVEDSCFAFTWTAVPDAKYYKVSAFEVVGEDDYKCLPGYDGLTVFNADTLKMGQLTPETAYLVEVKAGLADYQSESASAEATTLELAFEKKIPQGLTATSVTSTGFKAVWDEMADADDYSVTLLKHGYSAETTEQGYDFSDKYNGLPILWTTSSDIYYSIKGFYGESAPSLRLSADGDNLVIAYPETLIDQVSFWCRASAMEAKIRIETYDGTKWTETEEIDVPTVGSTLTVTTEGATMVRLTFVRKSGYVTIDDVTAECRVLERIPVDGYNTVKTDGRAGFTFSGLEPGQVYGFKVRGISAGVLSYESAECTVILLESTGIIQPATVGNGTKSVYDISGRRITGQPLTHGIYIIKEDDGSTRKVIVR